MGNKYFLKETSTILPYYNCLYLTKNNRIVKFAVLNSSWLP